MITIQTILENLVISIIVLSLLWFLRGSLWRLVSTVNAFFIPRNISNGWRTTFWKGEDTFNESATVYQFLHWVWGTITYTKRGEIKPRIYNFSGTIREKILVATYEVTGRSVFDRGAFTLALDSSGRNLEGMYCWTDDDKKSEPQSDRYVWEKI